MIIIRNDLNDDITFFFEDEEIVLGPQKTASFLKENFDKLRLENYIVKIKNGVIKVKGEWITQY